MIYFLRLMFVIGFSIIGICSQAQKKTAVPDSSNSFQKNFLLVPIIIKSPETKWGLGYASSYFFKVKKGDTITRTSNIESIGLATLRQQLVLMLGTNIYSPNEKYIFRMRNSFSKFPDKYWGIGDNTSRDNVEQYSFHQFFTNPQILRRLYSKIYVGVIWELQVVYNMEYSANKLFDNTVKTGKTGGVSSGGGFVAAWDTRNNAFSPSKGAFLQFIILKFSPHTLSDYKFKNTIIDARKYIKIGWRNVLALQAYGYFSEGKVPFRYLATFGGSDNMRGYYSGRYREDNQIYIQAEYRFPLFWRLGMVVFAGVGDVSNKVLQYKFDPIKYVLGTGLRIALKPKEKLNLRIDYGIGYQSTATYVTVTEAF